MVKEPDEFERHAKALFDESVERLDGRTRSKLTQARNAALEELRKSPPRWQWLRAPISRGIPAAALLGPRRLPVTGLAAVTVLAIAILMWPSAPSDPGTLPLEDFDIVADSDNIDLLQDVEFYVWLEGQGAGDATNHSG